MANVNTFVVDPKTLTALGTKIAQRANGALNSTSAFTLADAVLVDKDSMPTMFTEALTTFKDNLRSTLTNLFFQRYDIGNALQGTADNAEITELQNASSFTWSQSGGWVPVPGQVSSTV